MRTLPLLGFLVDGDLALPHRCLERSVVQLGLIRAMGDFAVAYIRLWDPNSGAEAARLEGHSGSVVAL
jgi:hypothetical protein